MVSPNTRRNESQSSNDLYLTPKEAIDAIYPYLQHDLFGECLDPCSGLGDIPANLPVRFYCNELEPCKDVSKLLVIPDSTCDFLEEELPRKDFDCIVANPPYNKAREFVLKGFEYADIQWHFLRLSFLEGQKRYDELFSLGHCTHVFIFTYRVSCDKGYDREPTANSVCYAWFRFDKNFKGNPTLYWLTKED